jgi:amidase
MDDARIEFLPAHELARRMRSGEISAVDVVEAHLGRIAQVNPKLNAVVVLDADGALASARAADSERARGAPLGPLHGVPVTIKDWIDVANLRCTGGDPAFRERIPGEDATVVSRLRGAGAIVVGKTNVMTDNEVYGPTFNPHNLTRSPGGSSGGEAAIIAAGGSALGLGSDSGGSLRQPAHLCGVATIKPTTGLVPLTGHFPVIEPMLDPRTVIGPIARTVEDLALALGVISGEDGLDPSVAPVPLRDWRDVDLSRLKIAWWIEQAGAQPTPETSQTVKRAVAAMEDAGAQMIETQPDALDEARSLTQTYWSLPESQDLETWRPNAETSLSAGELQKFRFRWGRFRRSIARFMADFDVLLLPAADRPAAEVGEKVPFTYTLAFSLTGQPAVVVPYGRDTDGLPIGVQIAARPWRDHQAVAAAHALETTGGWWPPSGV